MKLTIANRLSIINVCPEVDSIDKLRLRKDILKKIDISTEEFAEIDFKATEQSFTFNIDKDIEKEFDLSSSETKYIKSCIEKLSSESNLHTIHLDLYDKL